MMAAHTFHVNLRTDDARVTRALNISPEASCHERLLRGGFTCVDDLT